MKKELKKHIATAFPFLEGKRLLVACSGGLDSVSLTFLLKDLGYEIGLAHCNFMLRGDESDEDADFVLHLAERLDLPFFTESFDTVKYASEEKRSIQVAARELRYGWFAEILTDFKYDYVVTAHHADDDLETFFINLSRGTGLRGLTGIPALNEQIIRPLLPFTRDEIMAYAKKKAFYWREDSSNASDKYLRNDLRKNVLPPFKKISKSIITNFQNTQQHLRGSERLIADYMSLVYNLVISETSEAYRINIEKLKDLPNTSDLLYELLHSFGFTDFQAIETLLSAQSGKQVFSNTHALLKDRTELVLTKIASEATVTSFKISEETKRIDFPIDLHLQIFNSIGEIGHNSIYVDNEKLTYPLTLRKWREGDVFQPFGMKGNKKISKFFKDEKLSLTAKANIWLLCSADQIVWVVGLRADDRFKVTELTKQILKISTK